jgi:hypothetical protein
MPLSPLIEQASLEGPPFLEHTIDEAFATIHGRSNKEEKASAGIRWARLEWQYTTTHYGRHDL